MKKKLLAAGIIAVVAGFIAIMRKRKGYAVAAER